MFHFGEQRGDLKCTFCGKKQDQVGKLIAGPGAYICNECVDLCTLIIAEEGVEPTPPGQVDFRAARLAEFMHATLAGEWRRSAVERVVRAVDRHVRALVLDRAPPGHILLMGPSGSGKSAIAHALEQAALKVPVARVDVSQITCTGFAGRDSVDVLLALMRVAGFDRQRAERGILLLDNIDRLNKSNDPRFMLQEEFLDFLDGNVVDIGPDVPYGTRREGLLFDASGILVIATGRFDGIDYADPQSLLDWGLLPAFLARLPARIVLGLPSIGDLLAIVRQENSAWSGYVRWMSQQADEFPHHQIADDAAEAVARLAHQVGTGAWGVAHAVERIEARVAALCAPTTIDAVFIASS